MGGWDITSHQHHHITLTSSHHHINMNQMRRCCERDDIMGGWDITSPSSHHIITSSSPFTWRSNWSSIIPPNSIKKPTWCQHKMNHNICINIFKSSPCVSNEKDLLPLSIEVISLHSSLIASNISRDDKISDYQDNYNYNEWNIEKYDVNWT